MKWSLFIIGGLLLCGFLLCAGCTQPTSPPPATTTAATTVATTAPPSTTVPATVATTASNIPGPVQTLPALYAVDIQVGSNGESIDPNVIVTFRGGQGINFVTQIDAILTRGDGVIKTGSFTPPLSVGQTLNLPSTTGNNDRIEVYVTLATGDRYKIIDQFVPFRQYH